MSKGNHAQHLEAPMTYTVTFTNRFSGLVEVSCYFNTKRAAMNWAKWLRVQSFVVETAVFAGPAGGDLIQREAA